MNKSVYWLAFLLFCAGAVLIYQFLAPDATGRYQPTLLGRSGKNVFIMDTQKGHMWLWTVQPGTKDISYLIYAGKVHPGKRVGDLIGRKQGEPSIVPVDLFEDEGPLE